MTSATITITPIPAQTENATVTIGGTLTVTPAPSVTIDGGKPIAAPMAPMSEPFTGTITAPATAGVHTVTAKDATTGATATAALTVTAPPPPPPPQTGAIYIAPGVGSFVDVAGNVYTLTTNGVAEKNAVPILGGAGTSQMAFYNGAVYGQDAASKSWYTWNGSAWKPATAPPAATVGALSPSGATLTNATGSIVMSSDGFSSAFGAQFGPNGTVVVTMTAAFGSVVFGGKTDTTTSKTSLVLYYNGVLYRENTAGNWFSGTAASWKQVARDPRT